MSYCFEFNWVEITPHFSRCEFLGDYYYFHTKHVETVKSKIDGVNKRRSLVTQTESHISNLTIFAEFVIEPRTNTLKKSRKVLNQLIEALLINIDKGE